MDIKEKLDSLLKTLKGLDSDDFKLPESVVTSINDIKDDAETMSTRLKEVNNESKTRKEKLRALQTDFDKKSTELEEVSGKVTKLEEQKTAAEDKLKSSEEKLTSYHTQRRDELKSIFETNKILEKEKIIPYLVGDLKKLDDMSHEDVETNLTELTKLKDLL